MRKLLWFFSAAFLALAASSRADEPRPHGELRVFFFDGKGKPIEPPKESRIYVEPKAGGRIVLRGIPVAGDAASVSTDLHHGGQLGRLKTGETMELQIVPPDVSVVTTARQPYLRSDLNLLEHVCPMKCVVDVKPGDCPKCGMEMAASLLEFEAVIAVKTNGVWQNTKGFKFPAIEAPKTLREAVDRLVALTAEIKGRVAEGSLDRVHTPALSVGEIAKLLRNLALQEKVDDASVTPLGERLAALGPELDQAADGGQATRVAQLVIELQSRVETLKGARSLRVGAQL